MTTKQTQTEQHDWRKLESQKEPRNLTVKIVFFVGKLQVSIQIQFSFSHFHDGKIVLAFTSNWIRTMMFFLGTYNTRQTWY